MPVMSNSAIQHMPLVIWDGAATIARDIRKHVRFAFAFEVTTDLIADATFTIQTAAPDPANPCNPGTFTDALDVSICDRGNEGDPVQVVLPAGTVAGTVFTGTVACKGAGFVQLIAAGGATANVLGTIVLSGPKL